MARGILPRVLDLQTDRAGYDGPGGLTMLVVLGGSSPWTVSLLPHLCGERVLLVGRDRIALENLARFARRRWPTTEVLVSTDAMEALPQASLVLCQVRIGGARGRLSDEGGAAQWGAWGDETLGPGGVRAAIRAAPTLAKWARAAAGTPALMFTNPTDLLSRLWSSQSGAACVSVCEMPSLLLSDLPLGTRYLGVNHLGFAVTPHREPRATKWVEMLETLPQLVADQRRLPPERARVVARISQELRQALAEDDGEAVQRLLLARPPRWYAMLIAPLIRYFLHGQPCRIVVGLPNQGRLPTVHRDVVVESLGSPVTPEPLEQERSVVERVAEFAVARDRAYDLMTAPSPATVRRYLDVEPFTLVRDPPHGLLEWLTTAAVSR